jgi:DNA-binding NarL/FixJ family response regulator
MQDFATALLDALPIGVLWKDPKTGLYLGCTRIAAEVMGFKHPKDAEGASDASVPNTALAELADSFRQSDAEVLRFGTAQRIEVADQTLWLNSKSLLKNPEGQVRAVVSQAVQIHDGVVHSICRSKRWLPKTASLSIQETYVDWDLTSRESEVLYGLLHGLTAKKIATQLGCSYRTIESHIENIRTKTGCASKSAVVEKAIDEGLVYILPKSVIQSHRIFYG